MLIACICQGLPWSFGMHADPADSSLWPRPPGYDGFVRVLAVLVVLAACGNDASVANECDDGETRECYGGPAGSENVGPCRVGLESCSGGRWPGFCVGDIVPRVDSCNQADDDCNGIIDDGGEVGEVCTGSNGCAGAKACDAGGSVRCFAPSKNECDLCGGPDVINVGDECMSDQGCIGGFVCAPDANFSVCVTPVQNECGLCGGPAVSGLTDACMSADSCPGMVVCSDAGDAPVCNAPLKNECDACFPAVGTPGATCAGDHGCLGASACNGTGDALTCTLDASCPHLVISELATGSAICNTDEFIELYNPTMRTVSLAGYTLRSRSASSGTFTRLVAFASTATIAPHGFFLVASGRSSTGCSNSPSPGGGYPAIAGNTVVADALYSAVDMSGAVGSVWLTTSDANPTDLTDVIVVDVLGYDDNLNAQPATIFEGTTPAPAPEPVNASGALERKATATATSVSMAAGGSDVTAGNGYDTDDNAANFVQQAARVPQNASATAEP